MIPSAGLHGIVGLLGGTDTPVDFTYIAYGSGTNAAAAGDTALQTQTGSRVVATVEILSILKPNDTVRFSANIIAGAAGTATEIGVFTYGTDGTDGAILLRTLLTPAVTYKINDTLSLVANATVKNYQDGGTGASW